MTWETIPPDGTCAWEKCHRPQAHTGTHFCTLHQARTSDLQTEASR